MTQPGATESPPPAPEENHSPTLSYARPSVEGQRTLTLMTLIVCLTACYQLPGMIRAMWHLRKADWSQVTAFELFRFVMGDIAILVGTVVIVVATICFLARQPRSHFWVVWSTLSLFAFTSVDVAFSTYRFIQFIHYGSLEYLPYFRHQIIADFCAHLQLAYPLIILGAMMNRARGRRPSLEARGLWYFSALSCMLFSSFLIAECINESLSRWHQFHHWDTSLEMRAFLTFAPATAGVLLVLATLLALRGTTLGLRAVKVCLVLAMLTTLFEPLRGFFRDPDWWGLLVTMDGTSMRPFVALDVSFPIAVIVVLSLPEIRARFLKEAR